MSEMSGLSNQFKVVSVVLFAMFLLLLIASSVFVSENLVAAQGITYCVLLVVILHRNNMRKAEKNVFMMIGLLVILALLGLNYPAAAFLSFTTIFIKSITVG